MDLFDVLLQAGLITFGIVAYLLLFRKPTPRKGAYKLPEWNYPLKVLIARIAVNRWKASLKPKAALEEPRPNQREGWDSNAIHATAPDGTAIVLLIRKLCVRQPLVETNVFVRLADGTTYSLPTSPEPATSAWEDTPGCWSGYGLKIQVLEPGLRLRILFNGLLVRDQDNVTQHVKFNLIWAGATNPVHYPRDWSNQLAANALAFEPWRDSHWSHMLGKWKDGSWVQFGSMQGRLTSFNEDGGIENNIYLQTRGIRERRWAPQGYNSLRRSVKISAATSDGTVVHLQCWSYKNVLTELISGTVRLPNYSVASINSTDLKLVDFCESPDQIQKIYTLNISTKQRDLKITLRTNKEGACYYSGAPYQQDVRYKTALVNIDGYSGSAIIELGYDVNLRRLLPSALQPTLVSPRRELKWLSAAAAGAVDYCLPFESRAASCTDYVGGKGASLALMASKQKEEAILLGYKVPPGFCISIKALEDHLKLNSELESAIKEIEAAGVDYEESNFKAKCEKATSMFATTEIAGKLKKDILNHMAELRTKATDENLGPKIRFAVRSSAVGEDSEVLSAAGQNETFLGCVTDEDVLKGIQNCWGSMFAFTSAYYRRQNGQPCVCGGGVVVQTLVTSRVAGVMFTRHPDAGDVSRILITANYGLGESVVSGAIEPDSFVIKRSWSSYNEFDDLSIHSISIGSKTGRVTAAESGVEMQEISEEERKSACLTTEEVLKLAAIGVRQETLWGAGRDIEWALAGKDVYLLQARPITSLERWTEEELLHELDCPIMSDDELITFANTGEVLPRPMTAMTNDLVREQLTRGIDTIMGKPEDTHAASAITTHNRCAVNLYNSLYLKAPKEMDINTRMVEMAVHGHKVADDYILSVAHHRNAPHWTHKPQMILLMIRVLLTSGRAVSWITKKTNEMDITKGIPEDPMALWKAIDAHSEVFKGLSRQHAITSTASSSSQMIAMTVLLEGKEDFSADVCNEIGALLSSGDVLSAEVPQQLSSIARQLVESGYYEQFRALPPSEAMTWLRKCQPHIYQEVCIFLEQHGHRAIMEFDLSTKPWVLAPEDMMKTLQTLRGSGDEPPKQRTDDEIVASLKTIQNANTRKVLRWVMPLCRRTVRHRECTKARLILGVHKIRLALMQLGRVMARQWYLPHADLVFHFRFHELRQYIETRDPGLLRKAMQRQQYYPTWCKQRFQETNAGWLSPVEKKPLALTTGDLKIQATFVCGGEVVARACVVKDLSEIDQLQQGDILITHATDIGWSPYFPLLTGIVTELGGLISHGAVIAREYGLPCIVGATNATDLFRTGDLVRLSASEGALERVQVLEKNETSVLEQNVVNESAS